jgi:hypothetical protein
MQENAPKCEFLTLLLQEVLQEKIGSSLKNSVARGKGGAWHWLFPTEG